VTTPFTGPEPILLIDQRLTDQNVWGRLSHADQATIIKLTEQFTERVIADGSPEFMVKIGLPSDFKEDHILEKFYGQLAQFYRVHFNHIVSPTLYSLRSLSTRSLHRSQMPFQLSNL
jgi:hypothetical protein